jgi:enoyl-CoA hydratase/carnithine racemase
MGEMDILERQDDNGVAHLRMNTPETLNALSDAMLAALQSNLEAVAEESGIRAVIISGAGRAFCAGHNLREMQSARQSADKGAAAFADLFDRCAKMMLTVQSIPQPVIAQVHGLAAAAGCQLVATCDMAVASEDARFGVNGVNIGLFCSTPMVALTRAVPPKKAFEMLTTGRFADAAEALDMGLINKAVAAADLDAETQQLAQTVASKLAPAVRIGKRAFYQQAEMSRAEAYRYAGDVMVQNMALDDTAEGINAFLEKRDPNWSD